MAFDYLGMSNKALRAIGEVEFTNGTDFNATSSGLHQFVKDAVNYTIADIYAQEDNKWEFQVTEGTQVLSTDGTIEYSINSNAASVDWSSFFLDKVKSTEAQLTSITADSGTKTFTAGTGAFVTEDFAVGMKVQFEDLSESANNGVDFTINTLTATVMTVDETVTDMTADTAFSVINANGSEDAVDLQFIPHDTYIRTYKTNDLNKESNSYGKPDFISRKTDNDFVISPADKTYLVKYNYYTRFTPLSSDTDTTSIPERYEQIIIDGALAYINEFRDNIEQASRFKKKFEDGVNKMRRNLIMQPDSMIALD